MDKFGPRQGKIAFETHLQSLGEQAREVFVDMRNFVRSLGSNVIEEVRPHRVVYAKTMNLRTFLDIEPAGDSLILSIRSGRGTQPITVTVSNLLEAESAKKQIADAYQRIQ